MKEILEAIPSTEPASFSEFLQALPDAPERGDNKAWSELFGQLQRCEGLGLIEVERTNGKIDTLILTSDGAAKVRELRRQ